MRGGEGREAEMVKIPSQSADATAPDRVPENERSEFLGFRSHEGEPRFLPSPAVGKVGGEAARMRVIQLAIIDVTLLLCACFSPSSVILAYARMTASPQRGKPSVCAMPNERLLPVCFRQLKRSGSLRRSRKRAA